MAEAIFRIPSRTVQYGYVEIPYPVDGSLVSPEFLAAHYVNYVYAFQKEEEAAVERIKRGVAAPVSASREAAEEVFQDAVKTAQKEAQRLVEDGVRAAKELLNEGLGGVTEVSGGYSDEPRESYTNEPDPAKPWNQKNGPDPDKPWDQKVDAKKKPWETGETALTAVSEDW